MFVRVVSQQRGIAKLMPLIMPLGSRMLHVRLHDAASVSLIQCKFSCAMSPASLGMPVKGDELQQHASQAIAATQCSVGILETPACPFHHA